MKNKSKKIEFEKPKKLPLQSNYHQQQQQPSQQQQQTQHSITQIQTRQNQHQKQLIVIKEEPSQHGDYITDDAEEFYDADSDFSESSQIRINNKNISQQQFSTKKMPSLISQNSKLTKKNTDMKNLYAFLRIDNKNYYLNYDKKNENAKEPGQSVLDVTFPTKRR